jgi:hypothetical protein
LAELAIAMMKALMGVPTMIEGGISDLRKEILAVCKRQTGTHIVDHDDPEKLVKGCSGLSDRALSQALPVPATKAIQPLLHRGR